MAVRSDGSDPGIGFQPAHSSRAAKGGRGTSISVGKVVPANAKERLLAGEPGPAMTVTISGSYSTPPTRVSLAAFACHDKGSATTKL